MVNSLKNPARPQPTVWRAGFTRQITSPKQLTVRNRSLLYQRARYYDCSTGEFTSQDPLDYVDGTSLFRGYFVPNATDPSGTDIKPIVAPDLPEIADARRNQNDIDGISGPCITSYCGPDTTREFTRYLASVAPTLRSLPSDQVGAIQGVIWLYSHGTDIDFLLGSPHAIALLFPGCSTGRCYGSVEFCGKCVRPTVLSNILYGVISMAHGVTEEWATFGAGFVDTHGGEGLEQKCAYKIGYQIWKNLLQYSTVHHSKANICKIFNDTSNSRSCFPDFQNCPSCGSVATIKQFGKVGIGRTPLPDWVDLPTR